MCAAPCTVCIRPFTMIRSAAFVLRPAARAAVRSRCAAASSGQQWRGFAEGKGDDGKAKSVPAVKQEDLVQPYGELIRKGGVGECIYVLAWPCCCGWVRQCHRA